MCVLWRILYWVSFRFVFFVISNEFLQICLQRLVSEGSDKSVSHLAVGRWICLSILEISLYKFERVLVGVESFMICSASRGGWRGLFIILISF